MAAIVTIFDPRTGLRHEVVDKYIATCEGDDWAWSWTDGNWSCDCNRELELGRAGIPGYSADVNEVKCGDNFVVEKIVAEDGRVLYPEQSEAEDDDGP